MQNIKYTFEQNEDAIDLRNKDKEPLLNEIMKKYTKLVFLLAYSYVKDEGTAEDISQEVFIKCYRNIEQFRGDSSIKSWICRITINAAKDVIRKKSFNLLQMPKIFFENKLKSNSTEEIFLNTEEYDELLNQVLALPMKYREVIILHYFYDLKTNEVGDALSLNHNTVKTRLKRGRSILKENLTVLEGDERDGK